MEGVSYGHQYKYISTIGSYAAQSVQLNVEQVPRTSLIRFEDHFTGG
jgi:hypothetical protein